MLYVLDEPSVGTAPELTSWACARRWRAWTANGNSLVVVEHDVELVRAADWVIEPGPGAGEHGGQADRPGHSP